MAKKLYPSLKKDIADIKQVLFLLAQSIDERLTTKSKIFICNANNWTVVLSRKPKNK